MLSEENRETLSQRFSTIQNSIGKSCEEIKRKREEVTLLAVSKTRSAFEIGALAKFGQRHFGENYLQEGLKKIDAVSRLYTDDFNEICWHFIGNIQTKKCRKIAENFDWVHSLNSLAIAETLSFHRDERYPLQACVQINIDQELSKNGLSPSIKKIENLMQELSKLPCLTVRGLMFMPAKRYDFQSQRLIFSECQALFLSIKDIFPKLDTLSMGMSGDLRAAILEGSTMVRVGAGLFGVRI